MHAGIVLFGGKSSRMGMPKAMLPFGPERMLDRVLRLLGEVVDVRVVVAAPDQEVTGLPDDVILARDRREGRGPLEGLLAGLSALPADCEAAFATSCDVPLLAPAFVERMFSLLGDHAVAVPHVDGFYQPLSAVYRPSVVGAIESLVAEDRMRLIYIFERAATREVKADELIDVDPTLATLKNCNRPEDYFEALSLAGFEPPADVVARLRA